MIRNYFKIAFRNIKRSKGFSFINIAGLAIGIAVTILIGLWAWDEISFDRYFKNYHQLGQIHLTYNHNGKFDTYNSMSIPMGMELKRKFNDNFQSVSLSSWTMSRILATGDKRLYEKGNFVQPEFPDMLAIDMLQGSRTALKDPSSILLSQSLANALFGQSNPIGQPVKMDDKAVLKVAGIYRDLPHNTEFRDVRFLAPWDFYVSSEGWVKEAQTQWDNNSFQIYVQLAPGVSYAQASAKIKDVKFKNTPGDSKSVGFIHPMNKWHLYSEFQNGVNTGGRIQFVWMFAIIGGFVLLLACINFMNLTTARSENRSKEVGIRKTIGSLRSQLIGQFLSESILMVAMAFIFSIAIVFFSLPWFNQIADKKMTIPWSNPIFWSISVLFILATGLIAGSYPAFYLSSFEPVKVLKGTFKAGRFASLPRRILVVLQFTVSVSLIIGTIIVFGQIHYAKNRPVGYTRDGLLAVPVNTDAYQGHYNALRDALIKTGVVDNMSQASSPTTDVYSNLIGFDWKGKDPKLFALFGVVAVSHDFGKTVGWEFLEGKDFSRDLVTDSTGFVINEAAAKFIGIPHPTGELIKFNDKQHQVLGVIKNMVMSSPYEPVQPTIFLMNYSWVSFFNIRIKPSVSVHEALEKIEPVFKTFDPGSPFTYKFADLEYAAKFSNEERIGKLSRIFATLAILISCLGLFGLASFVAEQRTKEIGVRKVLGASILNIWTMLSKDFLYLVLISFFIAIPTAYLVMSHWLDNYPYRSQISVWIFVIVCIGAIAITILTVSFQAVKAAFVSPIKSLRSE